VSKLSVKRLYTMRVLSHVNSLPLPVAVNYGHLTPSHVWCHGPARASAIVRLVLPDHVCGTLCRSASISLTSPLDSSDGR